MSSGIYDCLPVPPGWIRLLTLHPSADASQPVNCTLRVADLDQNPKYAALSYVWGDPEDTKPNQLEGVQLNVTATLHEALITLRRDETPLVLWVDALCINQSDVLERNSQVALMGRVYENATEVLVSIRAFKKSQVAINWIRNWGQAPLPEKNTYAAIEAIPDALRHSPYRPVLRLFYDAYWTRVWVYQEVVLAKRAVIACGSDRIDWDVLQTALRNWSRLDEPDIAKHYDQFDVWYNLQRRFRREVPMLIQREATSNGWETPRDVELYPLVERVRHMKSTDPRDKIYALLGVARDTPSALTVNYAIPVEQVYVNHVRTYINTKRDLEILVRAGIGRVNAEPPLDLPSWASDLRGVPLHHNPYPLADNAFCASGVAETVASFSTDNRLLYVKGIVFDSIQRVQTREHRKDDIACRDLAFQACSAGIYPTGIPIAQAIFRTLITDPLLGRSEMLHEPLEPLERKELHYLAFGFLAVQHQYAQLANDRNLTAMDRPDIKAALEAFDAHIQHFVRWSGKTPDFLSPLDEHILLRPFLGPLNSAFRRSWPTKDEVQIYSLNPEVCAHKYHERSKTTTRLRSFFTTEGGYIGLGPTATAPGDLVCVFYGCSKPLVVRRQGDKFVVVGECYVDGIMFTEAMRGVEEGRYQERTFTLA